MSQILIQENLSDAQGYQPLYPTNITPEVASMFVNSNGAQYTNDVLRYLGKYCMYWWQRRKQETVTTGTETAISSSTAIGRSRNSIAWSKDLMTELDIFAKGTVTQPSATTAQTLVDNAPCYVGTGYGSVYKIPAGATFSTTYSSTLTLYMEGSDIIANSNGTPVVSTVTNITTTTQYTDWEYLQSTNRNTYPDSGTSGDYEYQFLNIPFENSLDSVKIQTGSYVGTGTYGASNPCSLTFDFIPKILWITKYELTRTTFAPNFWYESPEDSLIDCTQLTSEYVCGACFTNHYRSKYAYGKIEGTTIYWYHEESTNYQFNYKDNKIHYLAIG